MQGVKRTFVNSDWLCLGFISESGKQTFMKRLNCTNMGVCCHKVSCRKSQDLQTRYKTTGNNWGSMKRWEMLGKKESKWAPTASANRFMASPTCFGKPALRRALFCWLQLPDHITLWPQSHFIAVTSTGEVGSGLTGDFHFSALWAEGQWQRLEGLLSLCQVGHLHTEREC